MFSRRARVQTRSINQFSARVAALRAQGRITCDLTNSNPTQAGIEYDWSTIKRALGNAPFEHYAPDSLGDVEARRQIVEYFARSRDGGAGFGDGLVGQEWTVDNTLLTASTSEAYAYLFKLLCEPGDCVLAPTPSYPLIERLAAYENVATVAYHLAYDGAWYIDRQSVTEAMRHAPKAIVVVSPNNPTGSCVTPEELELLASFGVPLIVDQVFAPYVARDFLRVEGKGTTRDTLTFVLDGLSKRCGLPQLKLGWVSVFGPTEQVHAAMTALSHLADTYLSVNRPVEAAVGELLACTHNVRQSINARLRHNLRSLAALTAQSCVSPLHYQGGWSATLRLPDYETDEEWALRLLERGVLVQPGWLYDMPLGATVVVSLLTPVATFESGIELVCELCAE